MTILVDVNLSPLCVPFFQQQGVQAIQRRNGAGFAFKTGAEVFALSDVIGQHLDGDRAVEPRVARLVHLAHATRADFVGAEFFSGRKWHCSRNILTHAGKNRFNV